MRIVILGNAGAGKSTLAKRLIGDRIVRVLSLDDIAWNPGPVRKPLEESTAELLAFINAHEEWVIEGCYADLAEPALPFCTELMFLNPGVDACVQNCRKRPWEPDKFADESEQSAALDFLIDWVRQYETRDDEYGLARCRALFDAFTGSKREYTSLESYPA